MDENPYSPPQTTEPETPSDAPKRRKAWWDYALVAVVGGIFGLPLGAFFAYFLELPDGVAMIQGAFFGALFAMFAYSYVP